MTEIEEAELSVGFFTTMTICITIITVVWMIWGQP